jgi:hypothetical protein
MKQISFKAYLLSVILSSCVLTNHYVYSQISRSWDYSYSPSGNYESSGKNITILPSGKTITSGIYQSVSGIKKNALLFIDESGVFLDIDTSNPGPGYVKVKHDGHGNIFAAATLSNDSLPISKIVVARFDTAFSVRRFYVPDSSTTFPGYDVLDMEVLNNSSVVVASHWDAFPLVCLSLLCMDSAGTVLWERVDSAFEFSYDITLLADSSGGLFAAGSGRDTATALNFIFVSHYTSAGIRNWTLKQYSTQSFADMNDIIIDINKNIYVSGILMDTVGQVGILMKLDTTGNLLWKKSILPLSYLRLLSDYHGNIFGCKVPQNGLDVLRIEKLDSSGTLMDTSSFQLSAYFTSELGDVRMLNNGIIGATGSLYVLSFPKSDLFFAAFDTSLNLIGYDIFDSLNLLGESGRSMTEAIDGSVYVCGRFNYENNLETSNIGVIKYDLSGIINGIKNYTTNGFLIFPNPSSGNITMKWPADQESNTHIYILNSIGKEEFRDVLPGTMKQVEYNLNLKPGLYQAVIITSNSRLVTKISIAY